MGVEMMKINKYLFVFATLVVYTLINFIPSFRIKLAPLVETTGINDGTNYFFENFIHNWGVKLIIAIIIGIAVSMLVSMLVNRKNITKN